MATVESLSAELMENLMMADYCDEVDLFDRDQPTSKEHFRAFVKRTSSSYTVDTSSFFTRKGNPIPGGIYSLFGKYNGKNADEVRDDLISWVYKNRPLVTAAGENILKYDKKDMAWWALTTTNKKNPADELALWCLCKQFYRHAVVYTPDHTWTTLKDKSAPIDQIDRVCDIHLIYMGYGKFGLVKPISEDHVKSTDLQPAIQESRKVVTMKPKRTVIQRTRHGKHPARNTSAHINYKDLNEGESSTPKIMSPRGKKRKRDSKTNPIEPTDKPVKPHNIERDNDPPQVGDIIGTAIKKEVKQEQQKAEDKAYEEILGPRRKRLTTAPKRTTTEQSTQPTPTLYTHAHGHQCTRKKCDPIIVSKRGIIKPSRPATAHMHISQYICDKMIEGQQGQSTKSIETPVGETNRDTINKTVPDIETTSAHTTKSIDTEDPLRTNLMTIVADIHADPTNDEHDTTITKSIDIQENGSRIGLAEETTTTGDAHTDASSMKSTDNQQDEHRSDLTQEPSTIIDQDTPVATSSDKRVSDSHAKTTETSTTSKHEHETNQSNTDTKSSNILPQHAAAEGLLMLQELAQLDAPEPDDLPDIPLIADIENTKKDESDDTITYDPTEFNTVPLNTDPDPKLRKGILTITNIGIRSKPTDTNTDPVGPITSEGKLRCDFCTRSFNTRTEKTQHMNRRHSHQLAAVKEQMVKQKPESKETQKGKTVSTSPKSNKNTGSKKPSLRSTNTGISGTKTGGYNATKSMNTKSKQTGASAAKTSTSGKSRTFNCSSCEDSYDSQSGLNTHYKATHPPVQCTVCDKYCATPNTLARHMYKHKEHPHKCKICKEDFAFKSELEGHLIKHQAEPGFYCEECDKSFMRFPDLSAHAKTHNGETHHCIVRGCDYKAIDRRYLKIHLKTTHAKEEEYLYECDICGSWFKFYQQRKRHCERDH